MDIEKRQHGRSKCYSHCLLKCFDGTFQGVMFDISLGGALIRVNGGNNLHIGSRCDLNVSPNRKLLTAERSAKVVRMSAGNIGVGFL